ncbi:17205_t:CDS:2 [Acaulospora colombiana]|uniref:17205_t:CDS:1 n=1 Tax=Acaulospora colombiana TaxID=27376 RepID=A0ACA9LNQ3_9GLOM|nr:17205_t:CDS:2 [Acaulospora colombiana]
MNIEKLSRIGVGMYRMCIGNVENEKALMKALTKNPDGTDINVIDTSANYCDGDSERLIGKFLSSRNKDCLSRADLCLASKFGYIQGENLALYHNGAFKTKYLDILFIHNPEYFLIHNINCSDEAKVKGFQKLMLERIGQTFEAMEEVLKSGLIRSYGISSNSFSISHDDNHFLPYESLIDIAKVAAKRVRGTEKHGFSAVQMPGNLLEQTGLKTTAKWAQANGLKVFINRPFNAFNNDGSFRLASYPKPPYDHIKQITLTNLETKIKDEGGMKTPFHFILDLVKQLDNQLPDIKSVFDWESYRQSVNATLRQFRGSSDVNSILQPFLDTFDAEVRYRGSQQVRKYLIECQGFNALAKNENLTIEEFSLQFLLESGVVDVVLMGMTREAYVEFAKRMLRSTL